MSRLSSDSEPLMLHRGEHAETNAGATLAHNGASPDQCAHNAGVQDEGDQGDKLPSLVCFAFQQGAVGASLWHGPSRMLTVLPDALIGAHSSDFSPDVQRNPSYPPSSGLLGQCREQDTISMSTCLLPANELLSVLILRKFWSSFVQTLF